MARDRSIHLRSWRQVQGVGILTLPLLMLLGPACGSAGAGGAERAYLDDPTYRRSELEASLVNPSNLYSKLRLERYASGGRRDWELLPEWNPRAAPFQLGGAPSAVGGSAVAVPREARDGLPRALVALGEDAFFRYPVQLATPLEALGIDAAKAERYGLWTDRDRGVGGLVLAEMADGRRRLAFTCASCHSNLRDDGTIEAGAPNQHFDLGLALYDAAPGLDDQVRARFKTWGRGRIDVTTIDGSLPVRIPDLRPTRWLTHLHYDATVAQRSIVTLAIRIETLIITSHSEAIRPPRAVALGLAHYLWSLSEGVRSAAPSSSDVERQRASGQRVFETRCSACHKGQGLTGPPAELSVVGTDPEAGLSPDRGTGFYRVPSLRGVATRGTLLHDGSIASLDAMFDPRRLSADYSEGARRSGPILGHVFGLGLPESDRANLIAHLLSL